MSRGIVYLFSGLSVAERLVVSIWSLRKHYKGPVTILTCGAEEEVEADRMGSCFGCSVLPFQSPDVEYGPLLMKTRIPELTPYDDTVYLDADTLVVGCVQELFGSALTLIKHGGRSMVNSHPIKWIIPWRGISSDIDELVEAQLMGASLTINMGVFGFRKGNPEMGEWKRLADRKKDAFIVDEIAMQLLTTRLSFRLLGDEFNRCLPRGKQGDVRIWHFDRKRHCRDEADCQSIWIPAFREACREGVCDLQKWAGKYDIRLRRYLNKT